MDNSLVDSVRSDLESFKGVRERAPSESSVDFFSSSDSNDGYESDNTLDNVSEIAYSDSELESSVRQEIKDQRSNTVNSFSSHKIDSMTFREHWIPQKGVQVTVTIRDREMSV
ncbi:hypothetical protein PMAYCL1PPCAC_30851, partial [Pristionchus mayeri]